MDLAIPSADWVRFLGKELGYAILAPMRELRELRDKFKLQRTQVRNMNDATSSSAHFTAVTLTGVNLGTNTDILGRLYVRISANGGNWDVKLFKATGGGGGDEVARATDVAASATGTLSAQNSSGLGGTVTLGATIAAETNDRHYLEAVQDYPDRLKNIFTGLDSLSASVEDDEKSKQAISDAYDRVVNALENALTEMRSAVSAFGLSDGRRNPKARGNKLMQSSSTSLASDTPVLDTSGNVSRLRSGLFQVISDNMRDESTGEQDILKIVPTAAAGSFSSANTGLGTFASHTPLEKCPPSRWRFVCVDETIGSEKFRAEISMTRAGDDRTETADALLQVGRTWEGPHGFGGTNGSTLARTFSKTGDGSNLNLAATSFITSVSGENSTNTDGGTLHWKVVANGSNWDYSFYSSSSYSSAYLVAKATNIAAAATFTASEQNGSGLSVAWKAGSAPVTTTTGTLVLNVFKLNDEFSVTVTHAASGGLIQRLLADEFDAQLNSDTSGSESVSDNYMKAGTFAAFITVDN